MRRPQFTATRAIAVVAATTVLAGGTVAIAAATSEPTPAERPAATAGAVAPEDDAKKGKGPKGHAKGLGLGMGSGEFDADQLSAMIDRLPEPVREDLADVLTADADARPALIEAMKDKAESGGYGTKIQQQLAMAEKFGERGTKAWADLPQELKDDLAAVRDLPKSEQRAALEQIQKDAEAGEYGAEVKEQAAKLRAFGFGKRRP